MTAEYRNQIQATVIADSYGPSKTRLTTMEVTFHRFILPEFNTHRVFSRNSASSRAIPVSRQIENVENHPAIPVEFGSNQPGMQAGEPLSGDEESKAMDAWLDSHAAALQAARALNDLGVHKQVVNRLLEPFMWHTVIVTATDWDGFWEQRISPLAQPEINAAAAAMREAYDASAPNHLGFDDWHLPYIQDDEHDLDMDVRRKVSAARCARVSYMTHDGKRDIEKDVALYERLVSARPMHASPLEHVAYPKLGETKGNFRGWGQLRHMVEMGAGL